MIVQSGTLSTRGISRESAIPGSFTFAPWTTLPAPALARPREAGECVDKICLLERAGALLLVVVVSPFWLLIALAIKLESPEGPVLYRQERVGLDRRRNRFGTVVRRQGERRTSFGAGRPIMIYKFRTMIPDAEKQTGPVWATERDPRVTQVGAVLRQLRLDELPQLLNILKGEMRLIGPRPERPFFVDKLSREIPEYAARHRVHPGITGLAQVEKHYDSCVQDVQTKLHYDLFYVNNRSTLMDLKILFKTMDVMIRGKGAR